jgi:hypothetical protein
MLQDLRGLLFPVSGTAYGAGVVAGLLLVL